MPRQDLPADSSDLFAAPNAAGKGGKRIISPSVSSASVDEDTEAAEERKREALSPSPEVDLSSHDIDNDTTNGQDVEYHPPSVLSSFGSRTSITRDGSNHSTPDGLLSHPQRTASPPLEGDEKEFTQTASSVRMRGMSLDDPSARPKIEVTSLPNFTTEESEEEKAQRNREAAEALFGSHHPQLLTAVAPGSSPLVRPMQLPAQETPARKVKLAESEDVVMQESADEGASFSILGGPGVGLTWDTREPEDIQIEDLDDLFGAC